MKATGTGSTARKRTMAGEWGSEAIYDYGFRIYNPSIAKFLSVDPLTASYPWYTPYQFAGNMPIWAIDLDGLEQKIVIWGENRDIYGVQVPTIYTVETEEGHNAIHNQFWNGFKGKLNPHMYVWESGEEQYKRSGSDAPHHGNLTIDASRGDGKTYLSFDPKDQGIKRDVNYSSLWTNFSKSDEGKRFINTVSNIPAAAGLIFGITEVAVGSAGIVTYLGILSDADDFLGLEEAASLSDLLVTNDEYNVMIKAYKGLVGIMSVREGIVEIRVYNNIGESTVNIIDGGIDSIDKLDEVMEIILKEHSEKDERKSSEKYNRY